jgi:hypothetical protein
MLSDMPFIQEMLAENSLNICRKHLVLLLRISIGVLPETIQIQLQQCTDYEKLGSLIHIVAICTKLEAFHLELQSR